MNVLFMSNKQKTEINKTILQVNYEFNFYYKIKLT